MPKEPPTPLFKKVDCLMLPVRELDSALAFYRDALGHELAWRTDTAAGLRLGDDGEIVLQTERPQGETDLLVESVEDAAGRFVAAGGRLVAGPFDIQIGRCAVVGDPFGNVLVLVDMSRGRVATDAAGYVTGNHLPEK